MDNIVAGALTIPAKEIDFSAARSAGPGGQNVNKVNSKAVIHWDVMNSPVWVGFEDAKSRFLTYFKNKINREGFLVLSCQVSRSQLVNLTSCLETLKQMLEKALVKPVVRKQKKPSLTTRQRWREKKVISARIKQERLRNKRIAESD